MALLSDRMGETGPLPHRTRYVPGMSNRATTALLCAAIAVLVAGCGSTGQATGDPQPTTSRPAAVTAADGTNLAACADGNCEVRVSMSDHITLTGEGDLTAITVQKIDTADGLSFTATTTGGGGSSSGSVQHGCTLTFYAGGGGSSCGGSQDAPDPETGVLAMQLVGQRGATAVLRLVSGKPGPPPSALVPPVLVVPTF